MNVPKAIEQAFAVVIRKYAEIGAGTIIRCWQSLREDVDWNEGTDRAFPCVDVRCSPPEQDPAVTPTLICECAILCATKTDDDVDHSIISGIYGAVQDACDEIYAGGRGVSAYATIYAELLAEIAARIAEQQHGSATVAIGGIEYGAPQAPFDDNGLNAIGFSMRISYSRTDF